MNITEKNEQKKKDEQRVSLQRLDELFEKISKSQSKHELLPKLKLFIPEATKLDPLEREGFYERLKSHYCLTHHDIKVLRAEVDNLSKQRSNAGKHEESEETEPKTGYTAVFPDLVDIVSDQGIPKFFVIEDDKPRIISHKEINGEIKLPPPIESIPWLLPRKDEVVRYLKEYESKGREEIDKQLFLDLMKYHREISELPSEAHYGMLAAWVMHTYLLQHFHYSPFLCLYAVPERGKSRTGKGITYVAYRGVHVESLREAYIIRLANNYGATLFFDVVDVSKKAQKAGSDDIILTRFEKGAKVYRVLYPEKGPHQDMEMYDCFGPTILGINEPTDPILGTRCVVMNMPQSSRSFTRPVREEDALALKERLVAFRAIHTRRNLPECERVAKGRLGDILHPLHQVILLANPEFQDEFAQLASEFEQARMLEKSESIEAQTLKSLRKLELSVISGKLSIQEITQIMNEDKPERYHNSPTTVGKRLSSMGFQKTRMSDGKSGIYWDSALLAQLCKSFGIDLPSEDSDRSKDELF